MYLPASYRERDRERIFAIIEEHPFATLVVQGEDGLVGNHLPLLLARDRGEHGTLLGHMARANPQWKAFARGGEVLAIFTGPYAYRVPRGGRAPGSGLAGVMFQSSAHAGGGRGRVRRCGIGLRCPSLSDRSSEASCGQARMEKLVMSPTMPELPAATLAVWRELPLRTPSATFRLLQDQDDDPPVYFDVATLDDVEGRIRHLVEDDGPFAPWAHYGGFFIEADGVTIAADEATDLVDEIGMHQSWTRAAIALLDGSPRETVCAWEESAMTVDRTDEDTVVLLDQVPCGTMILVVCPPVRFPLRAFSEALLAAVHPFVQLVTAVNRVLDNLDPPRHFSPSVASCPRLEGMNDEDFRRGLRVRELRGCLSLSWVEDANRLTQLLASTSRP